jgi:putative ABC transport system substrate-binding protein
MNRRDTLLSILALGVGAGSLELRGQTHRPAKPYRIGLVPDIPPGIRELFIDELRALDWREKRDYTLIETGFPYGHPPEQAARRVFAEKPDLIYLANVSYALAVQRLTSTIPVVMWGSGYPVEAGVAKSLARPGKNVTGNSIYAGTGVWGKLLQLLRDMKPGVKRIGVLWDYVPPLNPLEEVEPCYRELRDAARSLGLTVRIVEFGSPDRLQPGLAEIEAYRPDALLVTSGTVLWWSRQQVMQFAIDRKLPTITDFRASPPDVVLSPLLLYSPRLVDLIRASVGYVVRILRDGAKAGDLPIQLPAKFELVVNLKTAKALGLTVPRSLLVRADEVIE